MTISKMYRSKKIETALICLFLLGLLVKSSVRAQVTIGSPNLGFSQACADPSFNSFSTTFVFSPEAALENSNQFIIELSDAEGDFTNSIVVFTSAQGAITTSPATLNFSLPETTAGEAYRLRIKSTAPAATSSRSVSFSAYFKPQNEPFTINNLVSTGAFCPGGSYLLTIDNPGSAINNSPLAYPSLTFNWYRETGPTTSVFVSEGPTLAVNTEGTYFVETNYGSCTSESFSNRVTISEATNGEVNATIVSSLGNPFCPTQGSTTLSTIGGLNYQWFKNGIRIENATDQMFQTNESGEFSVQVDLGNCQASGSIFLQSELFDAEINVFDVNTIQIGESLEIEVLTSAINPQFEWFLNNQIISNETGSTFEAFEPGDYTVVITETTGCAGRREFSFVINEELDLFPDVANIPNLISPNNDGINDTWVIPTAYVNGTNTNIKILTNQGKLVFETNDYQNNWPENDLNLSPINQVYYYIITASDGSTKKGSITVIR